MNHTGFVCSLVYILNCNGGGKFFDRESVFPDELSVDAGDIGTRVYQCGGVNNFEVCEGVINCTGIHIDLFEVDTSTGVHITRERELCIKVSLPFKNPYPTQKIPKPLHLLLHHLQFPSAWGASLPFRRIGHGVFWGGQRRQDRQMPYVCFYDSGSRVPS